VTTRFCEAFDRHVVGKDAKFDTPRRLPPAHAIKLAGAIGAGVAGLASLAAAAPGEVDFKPDVSVAEIMESMVMPAAQLLWDAVGVDVGPQGEVETKPETDEDWARLRGAAITLAEAANTLMISGRHAAPADKAPQEGGGELSGAEIEALIAAQHPAWLAHAQVLHVTAMQALAAVDARNVDSISEIGGAIDEACEACHLQFWYPDQR